MINDKIAREYAKQAESDNRIARQIAEIELLIIDEAKKGLHSITLEIRGLNRFQIYQVMYTFNLRGFKGNTLDYEDGAEVVHAFLMWTEETK